MQHKLTASEESSHQEDNLLPIVLYVMLPLLREQAIIEELFFRFTRPLTAYPQLALVFVTTERENLENPSPNGSATTIDLLENLILHYDGPRERVMHLHYPAYNSVVAEQLNFALQALADLPGPPLHRRYVVIYNADSVVDNRTFNVLLGYAGLGTNATQQSSLFLWNVPTLVDDRKYHVAAYGLYQSCWTLMHEIPRYLFSRRYIKFLPHLIERIGLVHCVGHGLLIRLDVLRKINGIPVSRIGGEDLALGFLLKVNGYRVEPMAILENAQTPHRYSLVMNQLAGWFLGTLGYAIYWRYLPSQVRRERWFSVWSLTILGIFDAVKWLLKGPLIVAMIVLGILIGKPGMTLIAYLAYAYLPVMILVWFWRRLDRELFPQPSMALIPALIAYPLIPILRSIPAFLGLWWGVKVALGRTFLKPKTERS